MVSKQITMNGLWHQNPALVQLLGLCPLLAVSNTITNSLVLGFVTLIVLTASNLIISLIRPWLDDTTRLPAQIMVIASFVTLSDLALQTWFFEIHQIIGLFIALIVTNCTVLGRAESFASRNPVLNSILDGFMMGLGFMLVIVLMGTLREALGQGTLFQQIHLIIGGSADDWVIHLPNSQFLLLVLPPGAFICFGCLIALKNWTEQIGEKKREANQKKSPQNSLSQI
ncbi:MAG: electron transport complex subunit E [Pseudomonadales bacterium]|nr:electron transport complex subunit E [Pseudomonadales bacterium]